MTIQYEIYDETLQQVNDDTIIFQDKNINNYLHGRCHLFALVFAKKYNIQISALFSEISAPDTDAGFVEALDHAYCVKDDIAIDAKGQHHQSEMNMFSIDSYNSFPVDDSRSIIEGWIDIGLLEDFEENEEEAILHFINQCEKLNLYKTLTISEAEDIIDFLNDKENLESKNKQNKKYKP
jgi:hypothetical protein